MKLLVEVTVTFLSPTKLPETSIVASNLCYQYQYINTHSKSLLWNSKENERYENNNMGFNSNLLPLSNYKQDICCAALMFTSESDNVRKELIDQFDKLAAFCF
jgi:hypothetical protein